MGEKHYKRVPRGFEADHIRADFLQHNGLTAMVETKAPDNLHSAKIVDDAFEHFKKMAPIHKWLLKALG